MTAHDMAKAPPWRGLDLHIYLVGVAGFEPTASSSRTKRATKLRHTPSVLSNSIRPFLSREIGIPLTVEPQVSAGSG